MNPSVGDARDEEDKQAKSEPLGLCEQEEFPQDKIRKEQGEQGHAKLQGPDQKKGQRQDSVRDARGCRHGDAAHPKSGNFGCLTTLEVEMRSPTCHSGRSGLISNCPF